jgi:sugar/nucleoside kinase (ribokinase family)
MTKKYHLTGIGNAIVDVIAPGTDAFLEAHGITKGGMTLIDEERTRTLYNAMGKATEVSGGSAANTMAGFASFGGKGAYLGKVADDQLGGIFAHDMNAGGIHFSTPPLKGGPETARCLILVTPDAQRSMSTYLGACVEFGEDDVDDALIADSEMIYLEGYLFDKDAAKDAYLKATHIAQKNETKVALTLSDSFCVERHRVPFQRLVKDKVDILFANEAEILALYQHQRVEEAVGAIRGHCDIVVVTRGEKGSLILTPDKMITVPAHPVAHLVDTTGAGDQYAAGFLYGLSRNLSMEDCGRLGSLAAAEVISHIGPRPETSLADLAQQELGISRA